MILTNNIHIYCHILLSNAFLVQPKRPKPTREMTTDSKRVCDGVFLTPNHTCAIIHLRAGKVVK